MQNQNCDISVKNRQTKSYDFKSCVLTHTKFQKVEFYLSVFHRNITNLISIFSRAKIETYSSFQLIYINHQWIFFNSRCGTCKNKISKIKEKTYPERYFEFRLSKWIIFCDFFFFFSEKLFCENWSAMRTSLFFCVFKKFYKNVTFF